MNKKEALEYIAEKLPDDGIDIFMSPENYLNCIDVKIFTRQRSKEWYDQYFRPY